VGCGFYERPVDQRAMTTDDAGKQAVVFKLSYGLEFPAELASRFEFGWPAAAGDAPGQLILCIAAE
jgi:hypothetical protein